MSFSNRRVRGIGRVRRSVVAALIIATLVCPLSSSQAKVTGAHARRLVDSAVRLLRTSRNSTGATRPDSTTQAVGSPIERALQITHFRLCPRHLSMSVGENYTLVPVALDQAGEIVHGVAYGWQTSNAGVASVFGGTVEAVAPGLAVVTVSIGAALATVSVVVVPGTRRRLSDLEWDLEHANDCTNPEAVAVTEPDRNPPALSDSTIVQNNARLDNDARNQPTDLARLGKPAVMRPRDLIARLSVKPASASLARRSENAEPVALQGGGPGLIDGDGADTVASQATTYFNNAIGGPRFSPQETPMGNPTKTKNNLGSYNYSFAAPIVGLPGRGIGVNLAMVYNSRLWSKDNSQMTFNYNKGWPAAGWTLGYGRLIEDYDGAGNRMLLGPDGTRTHLENQFDGFTAKAIDGSFIYVNINTGRLRYPDGTLVDFDVVNNRWLPTLIRNANGRKITITYRNRVGDPANPNYFRFRW